VRRRAPQEPGWADDRFVQAALANDLATLAAGPQHDGLLRLLQLTHADVTVPVFQRRVRDWMPGYEHPQGGRGLAAATYVPMRELLDLLRGHGFKVFIVSGGGVDFMRVFSEALYGIPPEQVIGSATEVRYALIDGQPTLTKTFDKVFIDDRAGKPAGIHRHIGRRPIFAAGNSDGDQAMLEYTTIDNPHPAFGLIVHHTDGERETAYDAEPPASGRLVSALADAGERGWTVVDMRRDWAVVFDRERGDG
jgi:hypothetical protein